MIKVGDINKNSEISSSKAKKTSGGDSFSSYLRETVKPGTVAVSGTPGLSTADALLAAQMVGSEEEREIRKKLVGRAKSLLEKLEEIRDGLLLGSISKDRLIEISRFVKERRFETEDMRLSSIIDEIELRVEVELAKLMK